MAPGQGRDADVSDCEKLIVSVVPSCTLIVEFAEPASAGAAPLTPKPKNGTVSVPPGAVVSCTVTSPAPAARSIVQVVVGHVGAIAGYDAGGGRRQNDVGEGSGMDRHRAAGKAGDRDGSCDQPLPVVLGGHYCAFPPRGWCCLDGRLVHRFRPHQSHFGTKKSPTLVPWRFFGWLDLDQGQHAAEGDPVVGDLREVVVVGDVVVLAALGLGEDPGVQRACVAEVRRAAPEITFEQVQAVRPGDGNTVACRCRCSPLRSSTGRWRRVWHRSRRAG